MVPAGPGTRRGQEASGSVVPVNARGRLIVVQSAGVMPVRTRGHAMSPPLLFVLLLVASVQAVAAGGARNEKLAQRFRAADLDGNGVLSREEAERGMPEFASQFELIDANHDGRVSPEEVRAHRKRRRGGAARAAGTGRAGARGVTPGAKFDALFARADLNGDGALSREEAGRGMPRVAAKFERIDRDGDGLLTLDEMRAWLALRRSARAG